MKIIYCHNFYRFPGGEDQVYADETSLLESKGHEVIRYERSNRETDELSKFTVGWQSVWNHGVYREIKKLVDRVEPHIVHFGNTFSRISEAGIWAAKRKNVGVVHTLHNYRTVCPGSLLMRNGEMCEKCVGKLFQIPGIRYGCYRNSKVASAVIALQRSIHGILGTLNKKIDRFIVPTEFSKSKFIKGGFDAKKIVVKPNFVAAECMANQNGSSKRDFALFVGRLSYQKGIHTVLEAWQDHDVRTNLEIIGDGESSTSVEKAVERSNGRIKWHGQLSHQKVIDHMSQSRMVIMPSISYETFGRTLIEGFATSSVIVASRIGSPAELVQDEKTGLLFQPGDASDLAEKVNRLCADAKLRNELSSAARTEFEEKYNADVNYEKLIDIYQSAIG